MEQGIPRNQWWYRAYIVYKDGELPYESGRLLTYAELCDLRRAYPGSVRHEYAEPMQKKEQEQE